MRTPTPLEMEFESNLREAARICIREYRYRPGYFLSMLGERGGVATARALLAKPVPSAGFIKLVVDYRRPDLTMEHCVLEPKYQTLFTSEELSKARRWLGRA